ncbi:MAG: methyltransferase [Candidatus Woesearchaeota archaeon]
MIYEPREDSFLLQEWVRKFARGVVLDVGTGSGIQAVTAAKKRTVKKVVAIDISKEAVAQCKKAIRNKKITFLQSDLFSNVKGSFDTIIFNPPYLPTEPGIPKDVSVEGGRKGYETLVRFLEGASRYLKQDGIILIVFSSLTKKAKVDEALKNYMFEHKTLATRKLAFEELYVYLITKSQLMRTLEKKGISDIRYFAKGKRGVIYTGIMHGKKVAIKVKRMESLALGRIRNEAKTLKIVNRLGIGPKLLLAGPGFVVYEFVEGEYLKDWIVDARQDQVKKVFNSLFQQAYRLDKICLNKEEMHRPFKHAIVGKNEKVTLIDFERARKVKANKVKNVTQLCQFVFSLQKLLEKKGLKIDKKNLLSLAKSYKAEPSEERLKAIIRQIG